MFLRANKKSPTPAAAYLDIYDRQIVNFCNMHAFQIRSAWKILISFLYEMFWRKVEDFIEFSNATNNVHTPCYNAIKTKRKVLGPEGIKGKEKCSYTNSKNYQRKRSFFGISVMISIRIQTWHIFKPNSSSSNSISIHDFLLLTLSSWHNNTNSM